MPKPLVDEAIDQNQLRHQLRCCPWRAGQLAKAIHALQIREAKTDEKTH
jgi:hypothetical protein